MTKISIHAPVKGATKKQEPTTGMNYFNPRTREGCDADLDLRRAGNLDFNPRTREGCDAD